MPSRRIKQTWKRSPRMAVAAVEEVTLTEWGSWDPRSVSEQDEASPAAPLAAAQLAQPLEPFRKLSLEPTVGRLVEALALDLRREQVLVRDAARLVV